MPLAFEKRPSLVAYVTCGDPDLATTRDIVLAAIDAGGPLKPSFGLSGVVPEVAAVFVRHA